MSDLFLSLKLTGQIISNLLFLLLLVCSGNPLHSTALEEESRSESNHGHKATARKQTNKRRENEARVVTETPKRPARAAKNLEAQQESDVQATKKSPKSQGEKPPEQIVHGRKSKYGKIILFYILDHSCPQLILLITNNLISLNECID